MDLLQSSFTCVSPSLSRSLLPLSFSPLSPSPLLPSLSRSLLPPSFSPLSPSPLLPSLSLPPSSILPSPSLPPSSILPSLSLPPSYILPSLSLPLPFFPPSLPPSGKSQRSWSSSILASQRDRAPPLPAPGLPTRPSLK